MRPFPIDIDYMVQEAIETLRPTLHLCESYDEAAEAADQLDTQFRAKLGEPRLQHFHPCLMPWNHSLTRTIGRKVHDVRVVSAKLLLYSLKKLSVLTQMSWNQSDFSQSLI